MRNKRDESLSQLAYLMATAPMLSSGDFNDLPEAAGEVIDTHIQSSSSKADIGTTSTNNV